MKIGEITVVNEFTEEKAYEITDFLQNNSDRIKGIGIEAFSSTDKFTDSRFSCCSIWRRNERRNL